MGQLLDIFKKGSTDRSVLLRVIDSGDGTPELGVLFDTAGIDLWYRREGAAVVSITEVTLALLTTVHTDGGFLHVSDGEYRFDIPDAAFATGANYVDFGGTVTGMVVIGGRIRLVDYNPEDSVRMGQTALPNAAAGSAGGLPTDSTGKTSFNDITASAIVSAGAITTLSGSVVTVTNVTNDVGITQAAADKVWGTTVRALTDKSGFDLSGVGVQEIWDALTAALTVTGSIGKLLVDNINASISSRSTLTDVEVWTYATRVLTASTNLNDISTTDIDARLVAIGLDHLVSASVTGTDIIDNSIFARLVSSSGTADWDDFVNTTDSLQAIRDRGDTSWVTGAGGTPPDLLQDTTIATLANQTSFTLTAGSSDDGAYDSQIAIITDSVTSVQKAVANISTYTGATKTIVLDADPAVFIMAVGDTIEIIAATGAGGSGASAAQVWAYATRTLSANTNLNDPSAIEIRQEIDSNSTKTGYVLSAVGLDLVAFNSIFSVALAKAVWTDTLTTYTNGMAGKRIRNITAVPTLEGVVNDVAATTTSFISDLIGYGDNFFIDSLLNIEIATDQWQGRTILTYTSVTGLFTFDEAFISAPTNGVNIAVHATHIHSISDIQSGLAIESKQDIAQLDLDKIPLSDGINSFNSIALAAINAEADTALIDYAPNTVVPDVAGTAPSAVEIRQEIDLNSIDLNSLITNLTAAKTVIDANAVLLTTASNINTEARLSELDEGTSGKMANQVDVIETSTTTTLPGIIDDLSIKKNSTGILHFEMVLASDGKTPATGLAVTVQRLIDSGVYENVGGTITEVSNGTYIFSYVALDSNGDMITWKFSATTADDNKLTFKTVI